MERVKYQHYVPRFYLDGFKDEDGQLWCYDKKLDRFYSSAPENLGGERFFYDTPEIEKKTEVSQFLEKWFRPLEDSASSHIRSWRERLATQGQFSPSDEEASDMAVFMVVQLLRTPRARKLAVELHLMTEKISFFNFLGETQPELAQRIQNPFKEMEMQLDKKLWPYVHAKMLLNVDLIEDLADEILKHIWVVTENKTTQTFYTSDNPIVAIPHARHPVLKMSGLVSKGIQIIYPLSPKFNLNLFERSFWKKFEPFDRQIFDVGMTAENLEFDNSVQVRHAARFIYSRENNFSLPRTMCKDAPELRDPDLPEIDSKSGAE